ncbi:DUF58 domain-containing protein [Thiococcus pfennigii]|jgi:uncharacterized protein (DUF58 family)|uniref:DUF58 domain-containing protein n=1 Tax=Thiococcus pfennigii TaxID=1057 RepID=UPI001904F7FB|nr:DUF58 domain-containing protein [Thiococcus pfennigii]MBK1701121.1 DUF58 domain-containing protein [Thiococcus pfennigii]
MSLAPRLDDLLELRHQAHTLGIASHHLVNSTFAGLYASVFRGAGVNFEEVREYREGDDIRYMDWKVTARTDEPHMKIFREERERSVVLCVDKGPHMAFGTRGTFKSVQAARAAALIGWAASRLNDRVGGLIFGDPGTGLQHFRPARGRRALWQLLHALTAPGSAQVASIDCLAGALQRATRGLPTGSLIFVIADLDRDALGLERVLGALVQRNTVVLLPVDDPADWEIPAMGPTTFAGTDGTLMEVDTDDPAARRAYRARWEARRALLQTMAHRLHILLLPVRTDQEIHLSLIRSLEQRARSRAV